MLLTLVSFAPMVVMVPSLMTLLLGRPPRLPTLRLRAALAPARSSCLFWRSVPTG